MNSKLSMAVVCAGLAVVVATAPAQERVTEVTATELTSQEPLESGGVAAISERDITYQAFVENASGPIHQQAMVLRVQAFDALIGGNALAPAVTKQLSAAEVQRGIITAKLNADELALPYNLANTYLQFSVCAPGPSCTPQLLEPRQELTYAGKAATALSLGDSARAAANGLFVVESSAAASGMVSLKNQDATATMSLNAGTGEIAASQAAGAGPLLLISNSPGNSQTYMRLNDAAKEVSFGAEDVAAETTGITPPWKLQLSLVGPGVAMSAFSGVNAAPLNLKFGSDTAVQIGEDPEAPGQALMLVGPAGLLLATEPLASAEGGAAMLTDHFVRLIPKLPVPPNGNVAVAGAPTLQIQSVSNNVATNLMELNGETGMAAFRGDVHAAKVFFGDPLAPAANTAGVTPLFATLEYLPPAVNATAGTPDAAELQLKVNDGVQDHIVARWTGRAGYPPAEQFDAPPNYIGGSPANTLTSGIYGATIVNGGGNDIGNHNVYCPSPAPTCWPSRNAILDNASGIVSGSGNVADFYAFIGGGSNNEALGRFSVVGGGSTNKATDDSVVVGGIQNFADQGAAIVGGKANTASMTIGGGEGPPFIGAGYNNSATARRSVIGGGRDNQATGPGSTIAGGEFNTTPATWSIVPGGQQNQAGGVASLAAGYRAKVRDAVAAGNSNGDEGTFMWADNNEADFTSDGSRKFLVRASGGTDIYSNSGLTAGVTLAAGGGSWSSVSDKNLKENFAEIDKVALLEKLSAIPVTSWNYRSQDSSIRHIGPMGQDFHSAFGVGETETRLSTIDADGVALAAIQGLYEIVQDKNCEIDDLGSEISNLKSEISELKALVNKLAAQNGGGR